MQKLFKNQRADSVPATFLHLNDRGRNAHYNFNIVEKTDEEGITYYEHDTIVVQWPLTRRNVFKSLLEVFYPLDVELKLINDYNTAKGLKNPEPDAEVAYQAFLDDRETYRQQVINDCEKNNIPETL